jgi:hypothetical protein
MPACEVKGPRGNRRSWFDAYLAGLRAAGRDVDGWIDRDALANLLGGELPQPLALRCAQPGMMLAEARDALDRARAMVPRLRRSIPEGGARSDLFGFSLDAGDREALLASLRGALSVGVVQAVRVNGRSRDEGE